MLHLGSFQAQAGSQSYSMKANPELRAPPGCWKTRVHSLAWHLCTLGLKTFQQSLSILTIQAVCPSLPPSLLCLGQRENWYLQHPTLWGTDKGQLFTLAVVFMWCVKPGLWCSLTKPQETSPLHFLLPFSSHQALKCNVMVTMTWLSHEESFFNRCFYCLADVFGNLLKPARPISTTFFNTVPWPWDHFNKRLPILVLCQLQNLLQKLNKVNTP